MEMIVISSLVMIDLFSQLRKLENSLVKEKS
jgi:hypothetical protein